jgi:hypothetical protein
MVLSHWTSVRFDVGWMVLDDSRATCEVVLSEILASMVVSDVLLPPGIDLLRAVRSGAIGWLRSSEIGGAQVVTALGPRVTSLRPSSLTPNNWAKWDR